MSRKYIIGITALDRAPNENYIENTLNNLEQSGVFHSDVPHEVHIFDSGSHSLDYIPKAYDLEIHSPLQSEVDKIREIYNDPERNQITLRQNMVCMADYFSKSDADFAIMMEDDIETCGSFLESVDLWVDRNFKPQKDKLMPVVSFFTPRVGVRAAFRSGQSVWRYPAHKYYGRQCTMVRKEDCASIADWFIQFFKGKSGGHDLVLQGWMLNKFSRRTHLYSSAPCFAQHIGRYSSFVDRKKTRIKPISHSYQGREWRYI